MSDESDNIQLLRRAVHQMSRVIGRIRPDQATLPTPCADWDVREVVRHVTTKDLRNFVIVARGGSADWQLPADELDREWRDQFDSAARQLLEIWEDVDPDRMAVLPNGQEIPLRSRADQQIGELTVHAWDLVKATGQPVDDLDADLAAYSLRWSRQMLRPEARGPGKAFGFEVEVPETAPIYDRLAGWFGRDPAWPNASSGRGASSA